MADGGNIRVNLSEEAFNHICTVCDRGNKIKEAVKYCIECKDYCCQQCTDMHKLFTLFSGHSLMDVEQGNQSGNQATNLPEFPTERCCIHKGKIIDMYCQEHDSVGCYACIATEHKSCPDSMIYSIPDMLKVLFNSSESKETESRLKQMMTSMSQLSKYKNTQLEALRKSKKNALEQVATFQTVLKDMIRLAADKLRQEIEEAFKNVEKQILEDKGNIDDTNNVLRVTDDKFSKSASNRAQRFVCSKLAQKSINDAEMAKAQQRNGDHEEVKIIFIPDNALIDYIQGSHGIGNVQVPGIKRIDLYKLKGSQDINIRVSDEFTRCRSYGCCLISVQQLLVTECNSQKLIRVDTKNMTVVDHCSLGCYIYGVCLVNNKEVAVGCESPNKIQFVSIRKKMTLTRKIDTTHRCYGIAMKNDLLYVTDSKASLYVYDLNGSLLKTVTNDNAGSRLFTQSTHITVNDVGNKMFVGTYGKGFVCFDRSGDYLSSITDNDLECVDGVYCDGSGNVFVAGRSSHNILQYNEDGKKIGVVVKQEHGLTNPSSIAFNPRDNRLFVTLFGSDVLKVFELE